VRVKLDTVRLKPDITGTRSAPEAVATR
jgi:hypothetical protein